jgi:hypothetical protein
VVDSLVASFFFLLQQIVDSKCVVPTKAMIQSRKEPVDDANAIKPAGNEVDELVEEQM